MGMAAPSVVVAIGKAAGAMAAGAVDVWERREPATGNRQLATGNGQWTGSW